MFDISTPEKAQRYFGASPRARDLIALLPIKLEDAEDCTPAGRRKAISKLRTAYAAEIARGQEGSWLYSISRQTSLELLLQAEEAALQAAEAAATSASVSLQAAA